MKFKKIVRPASEFIILSLLKEKGESYPYEIARSLRNEIFRNQKEMISGLNALIELGENILQSSEIPDKFNEKLLKFIRNVRNPMIKQLGKQVMEYSLEDEELLKDIKDFIDDSKKILQEKKEQIKIWESHQAIYQVISNLEERGLIRESRTDIHNGRERKLFRITDKGETAAIAMISQFGQLNQAIIPRAKIFSNRLDMLLEDHVKIVLRILNKIYKQEFLVKMISDLGHEITGMLEDLFPLIKNDSFLIPLLLEDFSIDNFLNSENINDFQKLLLKQILKEKLKKYRNSIDAIISTLK